MLRCGASATRGMCRQPHWHGTRCKWDLSDVHLDMFVKGEPNYGKLARGILLRMTQGLSTNLDAMGDASASSAVKAVALAQAFHEKERGALAGRLVFTPSMVHRPDTGEGPLKVLRLQLALAAPLRPRAAPPAPQEARDYSRGGMYVPNATGGAFGPDAASQSSTNAGPMGTRQRAMADTYRPLRADTPTELARAIVSQWRRYAILPDSAGDAGSSGRNSGSTGGANAPREPFLLTRGAPAAGRALRALAFVCSDLRKGHVADTPMPVVAPVFWTSPPRGGGDAGGQRYVILCLQRAPARTWNGSSWA